jgi:hypothetical protein
MATWLGNLEAAGGRRPSVGGEDRFFKQFVDATYNHRAYFKEGGELALLRACVAMRLLREPR